MNNCCNNGGATALPLWCLQWGGRWELPWCCHLSGMLGGCPVCQLLCQPSAGGTRDGRAAGPAAPGIGASRLGSAGKELLIFLQSPACNRERQPGTGTALRPCSHLPPPNLILRLSQRALFTSVSKGMYGYRAVVSAAGSSQGQLCRV